MATPSMDTAAASDVLRFGPFELHIQRNELRRQGRRLKLQPQPFKLLVLLASRGGAVVTRDEIRRTLWPDGTYVDFDQSVNFAVRQIRDVLGDSAERPLFIETVPRRGYRFIAPIESRDRRPEDESTPALEKALWQNVAELRLAEQRRQRYLKMALAAVVALLVVVALLAWR